MLARIILVLEELGRDGMRFIRNLTLNQQLIFSGVIVGGASGVAAFLFDRMIVFAAGISIAQLSQVSTGWRIAGLLIFPALGSCFGALLIYYFSPEASGHGVNEVYTAIQQSNGRIPGKVAVVKLLASALTIGCGGSAGREGPIIHIGGSVGSWIGQKLRVSDQNLKMLVAAGASAGLAASFGVPLAAVFFTMEVLLRDFANESFPAVVIASVSGVASAGIFLGNTQMPAPLAYSTPGLWDLFIYALLGLLCAPFGVLYMRCLHKVEHWTENDWHMPQWLKPALGGVAVGIIAIWLPEILGTGQNTINAALQGQLLGWKTGALALAKIAGTAATLGTGGSGGAFMPALFIGSTAGSAWAIAAHYCLGIPFATGAFAIVGMAAVVTSAYKAPVTAMILALEISRNYGILMPVMLACIIAHLTTRTQQAPPVIEQ